MARHADFVYFYEIFGSREPSANHVVSSLPTRISVVSFRIPVPAWWGGSGLSIEPQSAFTPRCDEDIAFATTNAC